MVPAAAEAQHGRAWSYMELTIKSFEDLHKLYWKCILEANQINTRARELRRTRAGYGATENEQRLKVVRKTMHTVRRVLRDRYESWSEANTLLNQTALKDLLAEEELDE